MKMRYNQCHVIEDRQFKRDSHGGLANAVTDIIDPFSRPGSKIGQVVTAYSFVRRKNAHECGDSAASDCLGV